MHNMAFDAVIDQPRDLPARATPHVQRGCCNHVAGLKAEDAVLAEGKERGWSLVARRWRCARGELDLVFTDGPEYVVVEVKSARDFDTALSRITERQVKRLYQAAEMFLGSRAEGAFARIRFDAGLVDHFGRVKLVKNALLTY